MTVLILQYTIPIIVLIIGYILYQELSNYYYNIGYAEATKFANDMLTMNCRHGILIHNNVVYKLERNEPWMNQ